MKPLLLLLHPEAHGDATASRLNWLRAAVLGANDGIVSVAALLAGVAGATADSTALLITGVAGLLAGAFSMSVGEYVSVSSQRDTEEAMMEKERYELANFPEQELEELADIYMKKGLTSETAHIVARELTAHDAFGSHVEAELRIDPNDLTNAWHAAYASFAAFAVGASVPLCAVVFPTQVWRVPFLFIGVFFALAITGILSARVSNANVLKVTARVVTGGLIAMLITFGVGWLFGVAIA